MGEEKTKKSFLSEMKELGGMPWWLYLLCAAVVLAVALTDTLGYDLMAFIAVSASLAIYLIRSVRSFQSGIRTLAAVC